MIRNEHGETSIQKAARMGHMDQIPLEFLTEETLTSTQNGYNQTPLDNASDCGNLDQLLGIKFSSAIIPTVGIEWYEKNEELIRQRDSVAEQVQDQDIEVF